MYQIFECSPKAKTLIKTDAEGLPALENSDGFKYPFPKLKIGQSFTLTFAEVKEQSLRVLTCMTAKKQNKKFAVIKHKEHSIYEVARIG